jgi:hypothetical protein
MVTTRGGFSNSHCEIPDPDKRLCDERLDKKTGLGMLGLAAFHTKS